MKFIYYTDWNRLPESANALFAQAEKGSIFYSRPWFENLTAAAVDNNAMLLACVLAEEKVMAILPLVKSVGNTWYSLKHRYTTHYSLLLADNDQQQVLACLVEGLSQSALNALLLEPVAEDDARLNSMQQLMQASGFSCEHVFRFYNWVCDVQAKSFADYMAARPARLRNTIKRKARKLEREHGYRIQLFSGEEVPRAMSDYYLVYNASWKVNEQYAGFLDGMVAGFSKRGWSRLGVLYVDNQPVAAQLWFVAHGKASIFRLAYDKTWKVYSPGSILTAFLMAHVIDNDKVEQVDFLTGNDAYKQDWMSERRQRFALACVKSVKTAGGYQWIVESLRRILK